MNTAQLEQLARRLEGSLKWDKSTLMQYATDASAYRELPTAVAVPRSKADLVALIGFARAEGIGLIPRAAGTSLAGQVVGNGIVVDVSRHFRRIVHIDAQAQQATVEPGAILDELNMAAKPHGLLFGPETSTASRCTLAGMVGNNSCGSHSLIYGSTRDHLLSVRMLLDDGNEYDFGELTREQFEAKCAQNTREGDVYRYVRDLLSDEHRRAEIMAQSPHPSVRRRNNGYALDELIRTSFYGGQTESINLCNIIAGSEGTLGIITQITVGLVPLPPSRKAVVAVHLHERDQAFEANLIALKHSPSAVELMDHVILNCTKQNIAQQRNRTFVQGDPGAILIVEFYRHTDEEIAQEAAALQNDLEAAGMGYHFPIVWGADTARVWALRKAGLGVLSNIEGDAKPVSLVEDTAVAPEVLPQYMAEFGRLMANHGLDCVYHAHIGTGELHLRPVLNLKDAADVELFRMVATEVAHLVKKHRGSLSGEHGDGRLRGEFLPIMVGDAVYEMMRGLKRAFDPHNIFNPNKIVDTPPMNTALRYTPGRPTRQIDTVMRFDRTLGLMRAVEKCNGSGDCRKTAKSGGTLCPSFMATLNEANSTRARANVMRECLTNSTNDNPFDHEDLYQAMDTCLSCKACKSECPSSVDMAKLKAEFLQHWYDAHGIPLRSRAIAYITRIYRFGSYITPITNFVLRNKILSGIMMRVLGFEPKRTMPVLSPTTLKRWFNKHKQTAEYQNSTVYLLADEFTNYNDAHIGIKAVELLNALGYRVMLADVFESGRTYISKGLLRTAQRIANCNVQKLSGIITSDTPLIGIEPSAILSFRDEYPDLVSADQVDAAKSLMPNTLMFDEFFMREVERGRIKQEQFKSESLQIKFHGHCQQKSVASTASTKAMLSFPKGHTVSEIASGCCGMAGSFGYEREHYALSQAVGELVLFPEVRQAPTDVLIVALGTSCRHQITEGTGRQALHPIEVMHRALAVKK